MAVKQAHVVICEPDSGHGVGGFEWRLSLKEALHVFYEFRGPGYDAWIWDDVDIPLEFQDDPHAITEWVDNAYWDCGGDLEKLCEKFGKRPLKKHERRIVAQ